MFNSKCNTTLTKVDIKLSKNRRLISAVEMNLTFAGISNLNYYNHFFQPIILQTIIIWGCKAARKVFHPTLKSHLKVKKCVYLLWSRLLQELWRLHKRSSPAVGENRNISSSVRTCHSLMQAYRNSNYRADFLGLQPVVFIAACVCFAFWVFALPG